MASNVKEIPVVWYQAASCSGDSVALLNTTHPDVRHVLVDEVVPGVHINLLFQMTVMAGQGKQIIDILKTTSVEELGRNAMAVLAIGTCASYGGVFAAEPNPTGSMAVQAFFKSKGIETPVINLPGCPAHPDWFVGTVAHIILFGLHKPNEIDDAGRPIEFYGKQIHENCPRRPDFDAGKFAKKIGDPGCLYQLGCKGPVSYADCPLRGFNNHTNWCITAGSPCHACTEPDFPDKLSPLYEKITEERLARFALK